MTTLTPKGRKYMFSHRLLPRGNKIKKKKKNITHIIIIIIIIIIYTLKYTSRYTDMSNNINTVCDRVNS